MAEDVGAIVASIKLSLAEFEQQTKDALKVIDDLTKKFKEKGEESGEGLSKGIGKGSKKTKDELKGLQSAFKKSMQEIQASEKRGVKSTEDANKDKIKVVNSYIASLEKLSNELDESAAGSAALKTKYEGLISAAVKARDRIGATGKETGNKFSEGMKDGLMNSLSNFTGVSDGILGKIGGIGIAVSGLVAGIGKVLGTNEKFVKSSEDLKSALGASFATAVSPFTNWVAGIVQKMADSVRGSEELRSALERLKTEAATGTKIELDFGSELEQTKAALDQAKQKISTLGKDIAMAFRGPVKAERLEQELQTLKRSLPELEAAYEAAQKRAGSVSAETRTGFEQLEDDLKKNSKKLEDFLHTNSMSQEDYNNRRLTMLNTFIEGVGKLNEAERKSSTEITTRLKEELLRRNALIANEQVYSEMKAKTTAEYKRGVITEEQMYQQRISDSNTYLQSLIAERAERIRIKSLTEETADNDSDVQRINKEIEALVAERNKYEQSLKGSGGSKEKSTEDKINDDKLAAAERYRQALEKANDAERAGHINATEYRQQIHAANQQLYNDLENIVVQYKLTGDTLTDLEKEIVTMRDFAEDWVRANKELVRTEEEKLKRQQAEKEMYAFMMGQVDAITSNEIERLKASANGAKSEKEKNAYLEEAIQLEAELITRQREREAAALVVSEKYVAASAYEKEKILADFDELTKAKINALKNPPKPEALEFGTKEALAIADGALQAFTMISNAVMDSTNKKMQDQLDEIDARLEAEYEKIEELRQRELEDAGFAEATTEEGLNKQIEEAKRVGDEVLQYQLSRKKQEKAINDKYDKQKEQAEKDAANQKAQLEYDAAMTAWGLSISQGIANSALAVVKAWTAGPVVGGIMAGITAAMTLIQTGIILANPPPPPKKFASGGIVPGSSYSGDQVPILANSGELIMNEAQQDTIAGKLTGATQTITIVVPVTLDGQVVTEVVATHLNNQGSMLMPRATRNR